MVEIGLDQGADLYKWFLAAVLFGARISENIAAKIYAEFARIGVVSSETILAAGWNELVRILGRGGYMRYDFKTAERLLEVSTTLL